MKTDTTAEEIDKIKKALATVHAKLYGQESGDPKWNAQRNLAGRTHYVDDDTLRWHKSRVVGSGHEHSGLLFRVTCSDALDMHNTRRGFRIAVFDVFGTCIDRPKLEEASRTSRVAHKAYEAKEIDLMKHYTEALNDILRHKLDDAKETEKAIAELKS